MEKSTDRKSIKSIIVIVLSAIMALGFFASLSQYGPMSRFSTS